MENSRIAFLFPAFINEYSNDEKHQLSEYSNNLQSHLDEASEITGSDLSLVEIHGCQITNELLSQYIAYCYSCTLSDILKQHSVVPNFLSGYSMGIYAALYHGNAISFAQGIKLIRQAYEEIKKCCNGTPFGMATIVGLNNIDLQQIITQNADNVEIINKNGEYSFVISGIYAEINRIANICHQEGALHIRLLPVGSPYHSHFMNQAAQEFGKFVNQSVINDSEVEIVSIINQGIIKNAPELRKELVMNICSGINWFLTMEFMIKQGINTFIECGAGDSLTKIARFIDGDFKMYPMNKLNHLLINTKNI